MTELTVQRVVGQLRDAMFAGDLQPGTPLREVRLAASMHVGRSTIREALQVLVQDGLARRVPHAGVVVTQLSDHDIAEIYRARTILELAGVRAYNEADPATVTTLRDELDAYDLAVRDKDQVAAVASHLGFHCALVGLLGSKRLDDTARTLN